LQSKEKMTTVALINPSPVVYKPTAAAAATTTTAAAAAASSSSSSSPCAFEAYELFDQIRSIRDPEHPYSLEQLKVLQEDSVSIDHRSRLIQVEFTPTVPHCTLSTLIGLCIRVKINKWLLEPYKIDIWVKPGSHDSEGQINRQINDKERIAAALEKEEMQRMVNDCIRERE
jgi:metal-sulfur cluster biosynthetic enzyme